MTTCDRISNITAELPARLNPGQVMLEAPDECGITSQHWDIEQKVVHYRLRRLDFRTAAQDMWQRENNLLDHQIWKHIMHTKMNVCAERSGGCSHVLLDLFF